MGKVLLAGLGLSIALLGLIYYAWYLSPQAVIFCTPGDTDCMARAAAAREACSPVNIIVETGDSTVELSLRPGPGGCSIKESAEGTNYSVNCTVAFGETGCPGSLYEYLVPEGGGGSGESESGGSLPEPEERHVLNCGLTDTECKNQGAYFVENCISATITDDDKRWASGYWTKYVTVDREAGSCALHFEILNAVDIPPEIPPNIIGMTMDCSVPLAEFPISEVKEGWCTGELYQYLVD